MVRPLVTPEGVDLTVRLGQAGSRAAAFLIDVLILCVAFILMTIVVLFGLGGIGSGGVQPLFIAWIVATFLLRNVYFIAFESGRRAATPGKRLLGLRIVSRTGGGLSIDQIVARNLMREIEVFLPLSLLAGGSGLGGVDALTTLFGLGWALLFSFFLLFNRDRMRIGDLLAGTWVVEAPKRVLAEDLATSTETALDGLVFTQAQLQAYGVAELHTLEEVLRAGGDIAIGTVARAIAIKIGAETPLSLDERPFLVAYYGALRAHLERNLLLGNRRAHKNDLPQKAIARSS